MPFGKRGTKTGVSRRKYDTTMRRMRSARAAKIRNSRAISVSTGPGRNSVRRKVFPKYNKMNKFQRAVQNVVFKTTENKYRTATINYAAGTDILMNGPPWPHNLLQAIHLWYSPSGTGTSGTRIFPTQGMTDGNRIGDEIYVSGISVKLILNTPPDRRTTSLKVWFVQHNTTQGTIQDKTQFFHGIINNVMLDKVQTDRWPGLRYLGQFRNSDPDNVTSTAHGQIYLNLWIPIKKKVTFIIDGDTVTARGLKEIGTLLFAPYDKINTEETDVIINNFQGQVTLHYKDP